MNAVIFAGGKSSRMGTDKALLAFKGFASLSEYQYHKLSLSFDKVYLSAKENKFDFPCDIIKDTNTQSSPLVALISIFETLDKAFVLSVDSPFVDANIFDILIENDEEKYDVIIAKSPNGLEPLCAIYKSSILKEAKKALKNQEHKLKYLLSKLSVKEIAFENEEKFINLNYFKEYQHIIEIKNLNKYKG